MNAAVQTEAELTIAVERDLARREALMRQEERLRRLTGEFFRAEDARRRREEQERQRDAVFAI